MTVGNNYFYDRTVMRTKYRTCSEIRSFEGTRNTYITVTTFEPILYSDFIPQIKSTPSSLPLNLKIPWIQNWLKIKLAFIRGTARNISPQLGKWNKKLAYVEQSLKQKRWYTQDVARDRIKLKAVHTHIHAWTWHRSDAAISPGSISYRGEKFKLISPEETATG